MRRRWICLTAALMLMIGVYVKKPMISGAAPADPVDLEAGCTLEVISVNSGDSQMQDAWEDMQDVKLVLDLYKVADAEKITGYDTYQFKPKAAYSSLDIAEYVKLQDLTASDWETLAQTAAKVALNAKAPQEAFLEQAMEKEEAKISDLGAGLYLLVARGAQLDLSERVRLVQPETADGENPETAEKLVTVAYSDRYEYQFAPQLIALPVKEADADGIVNTANPGPWLYQQSVCLKSGREPRNASLEIVKTIRSHEAVEGTVEPVTFVFRISGVLDGEEVFNEVTSLTFTEAGTDRVRVERIPAMADVTVTEIYSGASYTQTVPPDQSPVVLEHISAEPGTENVAVFENTYNHQKIHGHGIRNQFTYMDGWNWEADPLQQTGGQGGE